VERYVNNYATTVASGGYTSGSGFLNVGATSGISLAAGDTVHLCVYRLITGVFTVIVNLTATAVNSGTQFAATAEGADANALSGDIVICVMSAGAMNQIRADCNGYGTRANLPATTNQVAGNMYRCSNSPYEFYFNGSVWIPRINGIVVTEPISGTPAFSWANQGGASVSNTNGGEILTVPGSSSTNLRIRYIAAPATPYSIVACFTFGMNSTNYQNAGLCFYNTSSGKLVTFGPITGATTGVAVQEFSAPTAFAATPLGGILLSPSGPIYLKVRDDGTNFTFSYSTDGVNFVQAYQVSRTGYLTPQSVGYFGDMENTTFSTYVWLLNWTQGS
jgi:hypothetical protein